MKPSLLNVSANDNYDWDNEVSYCLSIPNNDIYVNSSASIVSNWNEDTPDHHSVINHRSSLLLSCEDEDVGEVAVLTSFSIRFHDNENVESIGKIAYECFEEVNELKLKRRGLNLLILDEIHVHPGLRGQGLALHLLHQTIDMLADSCYAAVLVAHPIGELPLNTPIKIGVKALANRYKKLGFKSLGRKSRVMWRDFSSELPQIPVPEICL